MLNSIEDTCTAAPVSFRNFFKRNYNMHICLVPAMRYGFNFFKDQWWKEDILPFVQHICLVRALKYGNFQQPFEHLKRHKPAIESNWILNFFQSGQKIPQTIHDIVTAEFIPCILLRLLMPPSPSW
jgi:hypothetical protein